MTSTIDVLGEIPLFRRVSADDRAAVAAVSEVRAYARGDLLLREGDDSAWFFVVATGRVKVFKRTAAGGEVILEIFGAGGPLGTVAAYESRPYPASAEALEPTTCLVTPRAAFLSILEARPSLVRGLLGSLSMRLVELTTRLTELTGRVEPRFARLFLKFADQIGRPSDAGVFVPLVLSRQELADLTGTTIETCIRIMSRWGKDEVLRTEKAGFVVLDPAALRALAGE